MPRWTAEKDQTTKAALYAGSLPDLSMRRKDRISKDLALAKTCIAQ
jgi:hypothetical protein